MAPIRLAVVDDSSFVRKALCRIFETEPRINVVGAACSGEELLENLGRWRPEVLTLDIRMPGMGGMATLDRIMAWRNVPVIILSTHSAKDAPLTIEALHRGAVDFIDKQQYSLVDFDGLRKVLVGKILQVTGTELGAAEVSVGAAQPDPKHPGPGARPATDEGAIDLVVIGASTGGPPAIQHILEKLATPVPIPIAIVQHMPQGFTTAFANRLNDHLPFQVCEPRHGDVLLPGTVYIAPAGSHLHLAREEGRFVAKLTRFPEDVPHRPSVDILFASVADLTRSGVRPLAVLLTGMGRDGATGMARVAKNGGYTLAQDEATSVVWGMPRAAVELGSVAEELSLPALASRINELVAADPVSAV